MEEGDAESTIRRVRGLLKLAARKGLTGQEDPKERKQKETEFFKKLFMQCDRCGTGTLNFKEVLGMARKRLKIADRLVSDEQLWQFFCAIDKDGGGDISFWEFVSFVRAKERNVRLDELVLSSVKRAVRLAIQRQRLTLAQVEQRFSRCADEGIIDTAGGDGSLGPEEMRRFFRKILDVSAHEASDRNLMIAFRAMDEDGGGSLDADEFMDFIREAIQEEATLCPPPPPRIQDEPRCSTLLCGMRGVLPERLPTTRPGTTYEFGRSAVPFCVSGRELESRFRICASSTTVVKSPPANLRRHERPLAASLLPTGLPKSVQAGRTTAASFRHTHSGGFFNAGSMTSTAPCSPNGTFGSPGMKTSMSLPTLTQTAPLMAAGTTNGGAKEHGRERAPATVRGSYTAVLGMLSAKDADALNRVEQRLFDAGVDVRGDYHKHG
mmetsp:Transcript_60897/g.175451  ORF Transcript_60897/g.175451 Transcript_60897/m.175451 type:complete len:437 (+) Transcript_60897:142-1452(+)